MADPVEMTFSNSTDASKAWKGTNDKDIQVDPKTLTLMPINEGDRLCDKAEDGKLEKKIKNDNQVDVKIIENNEMINIDSINKLNDDCFLNIFCRLPVGDYLRIERVCKRWKNISSRRWRMAENLHLPKNLEDYYAHSIPSSFNHVAYKKILIWCGNSLRSLKLTIDDKLVNIGADILSFVGEHCQNVDKLVLSCRFKEDGFYPQRLSIKCIGQFTPQVLEKMKKLRSLWLSLIILEASEFTAICKMNNLTSLELSNCIVKGPIEQICQLENLQHLDLCYMHEITDEFLWKLTKNCVHLEYLNIKRTHRHISSSGLQAVTQLKKLKILLVSGMSVVCDRLFENLITLEELHCDLCTNVKNDGIAKLITNAPNLRLLNLYMCSVSEKLLKHANLCVKKRRNGIPLRIMLRKRVINAYNSIENDSSPQLILVNCGDPEAYDFNISNNIIVDYQKLNLELESLCPIE